MSQKKGLTSVLRLTLSGLRIFFVLPQVIDKNGRVATSKFYKTTAIALLTLLTAFGIYILLWLRPPEGLKNGYSLFSFLRASFATICMYLNIGTTLSKSDSTVTLFNHLIRLQNQIELTKRDVRQLKIIVVLEMGFTFFNWSIVFYNMHPLSDSGLLIIALTSVVLRHIAFASLVSEITFINSCLIIQKYIDRFHNGIRSMIDDVSSKPRSGNGRTIGKVRRMTRLYREIYQTKLELEDAYSFILLTVITNCLIQFIFFVFVNIVKFQYDLSLPLKKDLLIIVFIPAVFLRLYFLTTACEGLKNKMNITPTLASRLWSTVMDRPTRTVLSNFLMDISSMDPTITCHGFAVIDVRLFNAMIANIFMYVVMLFQFEFPDYGSNPLDNLLFYC